MYQGHHPDGSSIQTHSAGTHYPFIVQRRDECDALPGVDAFHYEILDASGKVVWSQHSLTEKGRLECAERAFRVAEKWAADLREKKKALAHYVALAAEAAKLKAAA